METAKKTVRVLVTGVGAVIGYGIIKSIRESDLNAWIIGMDIYPDAVGQHWCDCFIQAKRAADPDYIDFLTNVVAQYKVDFVFFGTEQEIYRVSDAREQLGNMVERMLLNREGLLNLSKDKWLTREALLREGLQDLAIPSAISGSYRELSARFGNRILLKPRSSYASKGIQIVETEADFAFYREKMGAGFMAQPVVGDAEHEYTVAIFGLGDGSCSGYIALRRKLSQEGATAKAATVSCPGLIEATDRLCRAFHPIGPTNFQFRQHEGHYLLLEMNPRISSATSIRAAFGYNEAEMSLYYFLFGEIRTPKVLCGKAVRYIDEVIIRE